MIDKNLLQKHQVINDIFDYDFLDGKLIELYKFFEDRFCELYKLKADIFKINDWCFYIKSDVGFNAFAQRKKGYNIIGITNGYVIHSSKIFDDNYCNLIFLAGLKCKKELSEAFAELEKNPDFKFSNYLLNCSIEFTFGHEFQHILQFNSDFIKSTYFSSENSETTTFSIQKHAWEFDADRFGIFDVLKYSFEIYRSLQTSNREILKALIFSGISSIIITRLLFYLNIIHSNKTIKVEEFYTKKFSHPHPFLRIFNIIEYSVACSNDLFSDLKIENQEMLNNTLNISNIFLKSYIPNEQPMEKFFEMLDVDRINNYNNELFTYAIQDKAIKNLLIARKIKFE